MSIILGYKFKGQVGDDNKINFINIFLIKFFKIERVPSRWVALQIVRGDFIATIVVTIQNILYPWICENYNM